MKKLVSVLYFLVLSCSLYGQGLIMDQESYDVMRKYDPSEEMGFAATTPPLKISYRKYAPIPLIQAGSSCTGWAQAYGMLGTMQNIRMNSTNKTFNSVRAMDPYFLYAYQSNSQDSCKKGIATFKYGLEILKEYGCKLKNMEPILKCYSKVDDNYISNQLTRPYRIQSYSPIESSVANIKIELNKQNIIGIGTFIDSSFVKLNSDNHLWSPNNESQTIGGHAMCIVGYDDSKFGGAFEVMNSWGTQWGEEGFCWMKYEDLINWTKQFWTINLSGFKKDGCLFGDCRSSYSIYETKNGFYEGYLKNDVPDKNGLHFIDKKEKGFCFYTGEYMDGMRHGKGLFYSYNAETGSRGFFPTYSHLGELIDPNENQGFAGVRIDSEIIDLFNRMKNGLDGLLISTESIEYTEFIDNFKMIEEPTITGKE